MLSLVSRVLMRVVDIFSAIYVRRMTSVSVGMRVRFKGIPVIQVQKGANVFLGNNVTLNSRNYGYHASMHSPVKLMADREGAVIWVGDNTRINGACLHAYVEIRVGKNCLIAANVQIIDSNGHDFSFFDPSMRISTTSEGRPVIIEDNVWIGLNSIILPGVRIGQGAVIGANTVVSRDVPPMVVFAGNPGRVVRTGGQNG